MDDIFDEWQDERDKSFLVHLKEVEAVVERLLETDGELFEVWQGKGGICRANSFSLTGKKLFSLVRSGCDARCEIGSLANSHPYIKHYHAAFAEQGLNAIDSYNPTEQTERLNAAVTKIRGVLRSKEMKAFLRKRDNTRKARKKGAQKFLYDLRDSYARLEVLRFDLGYRKGKYVDLDDFLAALAEVKEDWEKFRRDMVHGIPLPGIIGYMAKLEYGLLSGFHFHVLAICDGSKHSEDITLARMLGEHWKNEVVSGGEGRYYNCNRHKDGYRYLGIGTLNYYDHAKYSALVNLVIEYMVKTDHIMATEASGERGWFRSANKEPKITRRRGRPRKFTSPSD